MTYDWKLKLYEIHMVFPVVFPVAQSVHKVKLRSKLLTSPWHH